MKGLLLVDKSIGWTSFDVVGYVRKIIATEQKIKPSQVKVGHTGTLDPMATGLLVILIGKQYTKLAEQFSKLDKQYLVGIKLGEITDSGDCETDARFYSDIKPTRREIDQSLKSFVGKSMQLPPVYSAIKVNGKRAYKMAREGKPVELKPRPINIYSLKLIEYNYPTLKIDAKVSSGTYIRSLVYDLGQELKCGAYMSSLVRTSVGDFELKDAIKASGLSYEQISSHLIFI